ncbi:MAG: GNAT family N-acetyltransferase [Chloroflexi bacterium]|nr:GNAT family N-acetyltransferase [Chloroflexota bacterium]
MEAPKLQTRPALQSGLQDWVGEVPLRQLVESDLRGLEWEGEYIHFRRIYELAYRRALKGDAVLWVADGAEGLLGQLFVLLRSMADPAAADGRRRAFIHSFRVRPEVRGRGLGSRMLRKAEGDLRRRGYRWASLNVARDNAAAVRLYKRAGYAIVSEEEGRWMYLDHRGIEREVHEPSWRMRKALFGRR